MQCTLFTVALLSYKSQFCLSDTPHLKEQLLITAAVANNLFQGCTLLHTHRHKACGLCWAADCAGTGMSTVTGVFIKKYSSAIVCRRANSAFIVQITLWPFLVTLCKISEGRRAKGKLLMLPAAFRECSCAFNHCAKQFCITGTGPN